MNQPLKHWLKQRIAQTILRLNCISSTKYQKTMAKSTKLQTDKKIIEIYNLERHFKKTIKKTLPFWFLLDSAKPVILCFSCFASSSSLKCSANQTLIRPLQLKLPLNLEKLFKSPFDLQLQIISIVWDKTYQFFATLCNLTFKKVP